MGKFFAASIIAVILVWLGPMCSRLAIVPAIVPAIVAEPAAPAAPAAPDAPAIVPAPPEPKPAAERALTVATYRTRKMLPSENGKYIVSVLRANKADVPALGVVMTLTTRMKGQIVEFAESGPGQTLAAGTTSYFGLTVSNVVFDGVLDAPEEPGTELEWSVAYRFVGEGAKRRCFRLRALPRRHEAQGISWIVLGESRKCADAKTP